MLESIDVGTAGGAASGGALGAILAIANKWWADRKIDKTEDRIDELAAKISEAELYAARNFVTQDALKNALAPVIAQLIRMEGKIDHLKDTKEDKQE